ncbi:MAG: hypothetical protein QOH05_1470, partial [Acetobacteraceae bacterium]|nr:hypothetical protein [Acetobacteraceae bacterium]
MPGQNDTHSAPVGGGNCHCEERSDAAIPSPVPPILGIAASLT